MTVEDLLQAHGVEIVQHGDHHHAREGWVNFDCPFCGKGTDKYHMGYSLQYHTTKCWRCGSHKASESIAAATGLTEGEVIALLKNIDKSEYEVKDVRGTLKLPSPIEPCLLKRHRRYLDERGFDADQLESDYELRGLGPFARITTPDGKMIPLQMRILIPYILDGVTVSWTTRKVRDDAAGERYVSCPANCEAINHKSLLFGQDNVKQSVCAIEGPFDVMRCGPGFVGLSGTAYTRAQVRKLAQYSLRGVWFDNEPGAQRIARQLVEELSVFPGETLLIRGDSKDPGTASRKEINQVKKALGL